MRRLIVLSTFAIAVVVAAPAQAKGPSDATIEGPGADEISFGRPGAGRSMLIGRLAEGAGFFPALFKGTPDPMLDARPASNLGPRYSITYRVPGPAGQVDALRQDVYPYAEGGPVTYTEPGQQVFGTRSTRGGWFLASKGLKDMLVTAGLPATPPASDAAGDGGRDWGVLLPIAIAFALGLGALTAIVMRRRPRAAAAS